MLPHPPSQRKVKKTRTLPKFPGQGDSLRTNKLLSGPTMADKPQTSSTKRITRNTTLTQNRKSDVSVVDHLDGIERKDSFSCFTPLPAIRNSRKEWRKELKNNRTSCKRPLPKPNTANSDATVGEPIGDDLLTDTIKKMRLGADFLSLTSNSVPHEANVVVNTPSHQHDVKLVIRLPQGNRVEHSFLSQDKLQHVFDYLSGKMKTLIDMKKYVLFTNEVPKRELTNKNSTLDSLGIKDKTVLALDTRH